MGQIISLVGTWMQSVAQSWLVYRLSRSEWLLGIAWFCTQIPVFVLGPLGGLAADRYSRHKIVVATQTLSMLQAFALAALTLSGAIQVWHVLVLATFLGVVNAFDMPGRQSLLIHMAGRDDLLNAISLNSAIFNAARVVGPALAGVLVARLGEGVCFAVNGLSFVAVIGCLLAMRLAPLERRPPDSPWAHLVDGFRFVHRSRPLMTLLGLMGAASIASMPALVLMPFFADDIFHRGSQGLGFLMGAMGVGAVIGTLGLAGRTKTSGLSRVIFLGSLMLGVSFVLFSLSPSYYFSLALMPVVGFSVMRQNASANTLIQMLIPDEYRGRIMALYAMMVVGLGPFGSLAAGAIAQRAGARVTVLCGGVLCLLAAAWFRLRSRSLKALAAALLTAVCLLPVAAPAAQEDLESEAAIAEVVRELERISGLKQREKIRHARIAKEQVKPFLEERVKELLDPKDIRAEELALKKFGFVPADFDLRKTTVDLLTEQAAAFYDFRKKKLFLIEAASRDVQHSALVHELAHALADQNFNLKKFTETGSESDDGALARLAVMEGQATWLMSEYLTQRTGQSLLDSPVLVKMMSRSAELSSGQYPVFEGAPLYMRETLLFPYTQGMLFQHAIRVKMGQAAFREVFRRPPASTQEILHPEKYVAGAAPASPVLPEFAARGYRKLIEGSIGELDHSILLRQYAGKEAAESIAPRWRGGNYRLWEQKNSARIVLAYASEWDEPATAVKFFGLYQQILEGKWRTMEVLSAGDDEMIGCGDDGFFLLRRVGARVTSLEGLESPPAGSSGAAALWRGSCDKLGFPGGIF